MLTFGTSTMSSGGRAYVSDSWARWVIAFFFFLVLRLIYWSAASEIWLPFCLKLLKLSRLPSRCDGSMLAWTSLRGGPNSSKSNSSIGQSMLDCKRLILLLPNLVGPSCACRLYAPPSTSESEFVWFEHFDVWIFDRSYWNFFTTFGRMTPPRPEAGPPSSSELYVYGFVIVPPPVSLLCLL